jgi:citrate synthase
MTHLIEGTEYYDGDEVVKLLGIKKATLYAYVSRGIVRSYRQPVGRHRLYRRDEIDRLLTVRANGEHTEQAQQRRADLPDAASWLGDH